MTTEEVRHDPVTGEILEQIEQPAPPAPPKPARRKAKKKANGRAAVPENETPRERYLRSSAKRMTDALTAIDLIAAFGRNRANYEYGEEEAAGLVLRLEGALDDMQRDLARPASREEERKARRSFSRD
jgi:hypothetical protein